MARCDSDRGELVLRERRPGPEDSSGGPTVLELRANGVFVMDTAEHASEQALADAALAVVEAPRRVLVGGLGLGFTLQRVLGDRRVERADVVEIEPALVEWMRDGTIPHGRRLLADDRVRVVVADLAQAITEAGPSTYDVLLLDVDNGPDQLVHQANAALYDGPFLAGRARPAASRRRPRGLVRRALAHTRRDPALGLRGRRGAGPRRPPAGPGRALLAVRRPSALTVSSPG